MIKCKACGSHEIGACLSGFVDASQLTFEPSRGVNCGDTNGTVNVKLTSADIFYLYCPGCDDDNAEGVLA